MTKYLISFPSEAMVFPAEDFEVVVEASHAVIDEAKKAGVYVFGGGIDETVDPVLVAADGSVTEGSHAGHEVPNGGYLVLELPSRQEALDWAAKIAVACRCSQAVRQFGYDPAS
ncbi:transcription initiation protein [Arthrobacter sp. 754]|uniref:YciI family protein n=1 Tax=Arthrobacter sp. 754 TaxID=3156315 RepID=UPI00339A7725